MVTTSWVPLSLDSSCRRDVCFMCASAYLFWLQTVRRICARTMSSRLRFVRRWFRRRKRRSVRRRLCRFLARRGRHFLAGPGAGLVLAVSFLMPSRVRRSIVRGVCGCVRVLATALKSHFTGRPFHVETGRYTLTFIALLSNLSIRLICRSDRECRRLRTVI